MTNPAPGTAVDLPGAANCRDLGGWAVASGGAVARGLVYRSTDLQGLTDLGLADLTALGLRTIYDLRTTAERKAAPDRVPVGVEDVHLDVLADEPDNPAAAAADLPALLSDPPKLESFLKGTSVTKVFAGAYRGVVSLPSAISSYHQMFSGIASDAHRPVLFHCTTGKDRTGWGSAALLTFLGVSSDDVMSEYLLTNTEIMPFTQPMYDTFAAHGGDPTLLRPALGVAKEYLETAFEEMHSKFGSIEDYFAKGLGLSDDTLDALRSAMIHPAG